MFVLFHYLLWKAKLDLTALSEGLDSWSIKVSFSTGSITSCGVMKTLALYGSIFASILLVKVVWDKIISGHTCRASVSSSPLLTDPFDGIQFVVGTYLKLLFVFRDWVPPYFLSRW